MSPKFPMGSAPDAVKRLVDRFDQDRKVFLSADYKEEQLRLEFLNPFFTALGWDMDNRKGLSETFDWLAHFLRWSPATVDYARGQAPSHRRSLSLRVTACRC